MKWNTWHVSDRDWLEKVLHHFGDYKDGKSKLRELKIPKIIHQIWLGGSVPNYVHRLQASWKKHHMDWEFKLWTDENVQFLILQNRSAYDESTNFGEKSDILRYEILYQYGGVYVDSDFICVRPLTEIMEGLDFFVGLSNVGVVEVNNALIGCSSKHMIVRKMIERIGTIFEQSRNVTLLSSVINGYKDPADQINSFLNNHKSLDFLSKSIRNMAIVRTGPGALTNVLISASLAEGSIPPNWVIFPHIFFYAISNTDDLVGKSMQFVEEYVEKELADKEEIYAVHLWAKSWLTDHKKILS